MRPPCSLLVESRPPHPTTEPKQIPNALPFSGSVQPRLAGGPFRSAAKSYSLGGIERMLTTD